jgi:sulfoxide reductase heme-binding subunit YedZ
MPVGSERAPDPQRWFRRLKPLVFLACLGPAAMLSYRAMTGTLGAEPIDEITGVTGQWTLRMLLITLLITPLRQLTGWHGLIRWRRMLGLFAFSYAVLHFLTYVVLDQFFAWNFIIEDIIEHPYVLVGFTAFILLLPLAFTSTDAMVRRLGGRRWRRLHRLAYLVPVLGVLHFWWQVKSDISEPAVYSLLLSVLLASRLRRPQPRATGAAPPATPG